MYSVQQTGMPTRVLPQLPVSSSPVLPEFILSLLAMCIYSYDTIFTLHDNVVCIYCVVPKLTRLKGQQVPCSTLCCLITRSIYALPELRAVEKRCAPNRFSIPPKLLLSVDGFTSAVALSVRLCHKCFSQIAGISIISNDRVMDSIQTAYFALRCTYNILSYYRIVYFTIVMTGPRRRRWVSAVSDVHLNRMPIERHSNCLYFAYNWPCV